MTGEGLQAGMRGGHPAVIKGEQSSTVSPTRVYFAALVPRKSLLSAECCRGVLDDMPLNTPRAVRWKGAIKAIKSAYEEKLGKKRAAGSIERFRS